MMSLWLPYTQVLTTLPPLEVESTKDCTITLKDGRQLIDGMASWWVACHGYNHPHLRQAILEQSALLSHVMLGGLTHPQANTLATRLCKKLPTSLSHVFFSESGSVAVEIAMKMALQFWMNQSEYTKTQFLYFKHAYHGDTFYTMSVCDEDEGMHRRFRSVLPQQYSSNLPTEEDKISAFEDLLATHSDSIAACIVEPLVQGAGGMKMHSAQTIATLQALCKKYNVLVIFDEIFTGFGRTGSLFAFEETAVSPDILCLSKALTGGMLPLAATIATDEIFQEFLSEDPTHALMHGSTFMGNALACAAANASLDLFETEPRLQQVATIERTLQKELTPLTDLAGVKEVRVKGAIGAVQCEPFSTDILNQLKTQFIEDEVWCRPFGDIIYTTPAFTISEEALLKVTSSIKKQVQYWSSHCYRK